MSGGGISKFGKTELHFHDQNVDSSEYIKCIKQSLIPFLDYANGISEYQMIYFEQDGAKSHTSN